MNNNPIDNFRWVDARQLSANDYNPNVVLDTEMNLLKFSLLKSGWIQPILATKSNGKTQIIDGFHRYWLSTNDKDVIKQFNYMVPVVLMELSEPERMLLTIRINRAKGNHVAFKMHELITKVHHKFNFPVAKIAKEIGADKGEIELLLQEGVFSKLDIANHKYSKAWIPSK